MRGPASADLGVLLVEDSPRIAERMRELLQQEGLRVLATVDDETSAIKALRDMPVDVLILDLQLRRLAALERQRIMDELAEIRKAAEPATSLLLKIVADPKRSWEVRVGALQAVRADRHASQVDALIETLAVSGLADGRLKVDVMQALGAILGVKDPRTDDPPLPASRSPMSSHAIQRRLLERELELMSFLALGIASDLQTESDEEKLTLVRGLFAVALKLSRLLWPFGRRAGDDLAVQEQRGCGSPPVRRPWPGGAQRPVRHADGGHAERGAQMERQPAPPGVVSARGADEQDVGEGAEGAHGRLEERPLPERQQPGFVARPRRPFPTNERIP